MRNPTLVIYLLLLLFFIGTGSALHADTETLHPVSRVGLFDTWEKDKDKDKEPPPPDTVTFFFQMRSRVYYKMLMGDKTMAAGMLHPGENFVTIHAGSLFDKPGRNDFVLEIKKGDKILRQVYTLSVAIKSNIKAPEQKKVRVNEARAVEVSMFVEGRFIAANAKHHDPLQALALLYNRSSPAPVKYDPSYPNPSENPANRAMTFSPLSLAALAYQAIRKNRKEKNARQKRRQQMRTYRLRGDFWKSDAGGKRHKYEIILSLTRAKKN